MILFGRELDREVALIAEIGVNHEGDLGTAITLVHACAAAGADAVKFQSYTTDRFLARDDAERSARAERFSLDEAAHRRLAGEAERAGVAFLSSAISEDWVPLVAELSPAIKIASGDVDFEPVLRAAMATGKSVLLSVGNATVDEIDQAVKWCSEGLASGELARRLILLHCVSAYPTPRSEANIRSIPYLRERYGLRVGYSNHVAAPEPVLAAVALGACVIEVHVTDRKEGRQFRDHALAFEPSELATLADGIASVSESLGEFTKVRMPCERDACMAMRKGIVAARDLSSGQLLSREDLAFARPATEFPARDWEQLVGRRLLKPVDRGMLIRRDAVSESN